MRALLDAEGVEGEVQAWDWMYCHERQRRAIGLDWSELSGYLPLDAVLDGLFLLVRDVFGVRIIEEPAVKAWHPDVQFFVLRDAATGEHLTDLYFDPFAREGKMPGGWMDVLDPGSNKRGSARRPPVLYLVTNITPPVRAAAPLLPHDEAVTLFHEFGHVLEFGLQCAEVFLAQRSWAELDFIEAPSQILENWAWAPERPPPLRPPPRHRCAAAERAARATRGEPPA